MKHLTTYGLFEMHANPYDWKWTTPTSGVDAIRVSKRGWRIATFNSEDDRYFVNFVPDKDDTAYTLTFESDRFGTNTQGFGKTGNAMRILATVFDIMVAFLDEDPDKEVVFLGVKDDENQVEPSKRDRIYKSMMADLPDNYEWELMSDGKTIRIKRATVYENANTNSTRPVVTFDFDGVMHTGVYPGTIHPYPDPGAWEPSQIMIDKMKEEAEDNDVYIVSARDCDFGGKPNRWIKWFVEEHDLPVKGIVCTNNGKKRSYLKELKSIRHYDDNPEMEKELRGSGIEFVYVDSSAYESLQENAQQAGRGSMLLMRGEELGDGTARLYAIPIERVLSVARMKKDNTKAQDAMMVLLGDTYYRLTIEDGKLKPQKVGFSSKVNMLKALGMTERNLSGERLKVVLNSKTGKTPLHWDSLKYDYIGKLIAEMGSRIMDLPGIRWTN